VIAKKRNKGEDGEQTINDAWHCRQQFDDECKPVRETARRQFSEENRCANAQRYADDQRQGRSDQGAVDERQRAKCQLNRIPCSSREKAPSELMARRGGAGVQLVQEKSGY